MPQLRDSLPTALGAARHVALDDSESNTHSHTTVFLMIPDLTLRLYYRHIGQSEICARGDQERARCVQVVCVQVRQGCAAPTVT